MILIGWSSFLGCISRICLQLSVIGPFESGMSTSGADWSKVVNSSLPRLEPQRVDVLVRCGNSILWSSRGVSCFRLVFPLRSLLLYVSRLLDFKVFFVSCCRHPPFSWCPVELSSSATSRTAVGDSRRDENIE